MPHHRKALSSIMDRLLADPVLLPLLVTAIAIVVLRLMQPDAALNDANRRYAAGLALHDGHASMPVLIGLGATRPDAPETAPEALTSIR